VNVPIYEYECAACERTVEVIELNPKNTQVPACPGCGGPTERILSLPVFHDFDRAMGSTPVRPFVTTNVHPEGKPMEFRTHQQLKDACKKYGVVHAPDVKR
jgi:putative FmdB family regulatory protein